MIDLKSAALYLQQQQLSSRNFKSFSSAKLESFSVQTSYETTFINTIILSALQSISTKNNLILTSLKNNLAQFLLAQKSRLWTWNYWTQHSTEKKLFPLPDDLDDSSCAWAALYQAQPQLFTGQTMAIITQTLVKLETKPGGPYHTWVINNTKHRHWTGIDLVVNSNIAYFLKLHQITLPKLTAFFDQHIVNKNYRSQYYPTPYPVIYFLARSYAGDNKDKIIRHLLSLQNGDQLWNNPLNTALAGTALLRLGYHSPKLMTTTIHYLQKTQLTNGSWPAASFCCDPSIDNIPHYAGAASLTTALVLEYLSLSKLKKTAMFFKKNTPKHLVEQKTWKEISSHLAQLNKNIQPLVKTSLTKLHLADQKHHISPWVEHFIQSLNKTNQTQLDYQLELSLANLWGWLAYTIYDDVFDQDANVAALSLANIAQRQFIISYQEIINSCPQFLPIFTTIMNEVDLANFKEVNERTKVKNKTLILPKNLPNYSQLTIIAQKSIGYALGPIAILCQLDYLISDAPIQKWLQFMRHYLTARQLNDDAHDWEIDLKNGQLTPVVVRIISAIKNKPQAITLDPKTLDFLQQIFWHQVLPAVIEDIKTQLQLAAQALKQNSIIKNPQFFQQLLTKLSKIADKTLQEQQRIIEFVQTYANVKS